MLKESLKNWPWVTPAKQQQGWNRSHPLDTIRPFTSAYNLFTASQVLKWPLQLWNKKRRNLWKNRGLLPLHFLLVAPMVKNLPAMQESQVWPLGWEDPLERGMATHSSILAWRIPQTEEPGGLQSWSRKESDMTEQLTLSFFTFKGIEIIPSLLSITVPPKLKTLDSISSSTSDCRSIFYKR